MFKSCNAPGFWGTVWRALFLLSIFVVGAHATTADDVQKKIEDLKAAIKAFDGRRNEIADKLSDFRQFVLDNGFHGDNEKDAFVKYSDALQKILKDDDSRLQVQSMKEGRDSAQKLLPELDKLTEKLIVDARFIDLLTKTTKLINASVSNQTFLTQRLLESTDNDVIIARKGFDLAWAKITTESKIHVLNSWFGDLRTGWREGRQCTSTLAMKTLCEAKTDCTLLAGTAPAPFNQESLCGFDPAPLVDFKFKGVVVDYTCVRGGKQVWDTVAQYPGTDPVKLDAWKPRDINRVVLRSNTMSLRCPFPVTKAN
jgi:hypothetical protein